MRGQARWPEFRRAVDTRSFQYQRIITGQMMRHRSLQAKWLRPAALRQHARLATEDIIAEPLLWAAGTWFITRMRSFATIRHNHTAMAAAFGLVAFDPLLYAGFL